MANKPISQLTEATAVQTTDLFVVEQTGTAKKLTGQTLIDQLATALDGHGGIASIAKTSTSGNVDTYTITYADNTTYTYTVTNGVDGTNGADGSAATVAVGTTTTGAAGTSASVTNSGTSSAAVFNFTIPKGDKGDTGNNGADGAAATISVGTVTTGAAGTNVSVTNSGSSSAAVFNFTIPKGDKGDTGDTGATGANWYVYIRWASEEPTQDSDMGVVPDDWMGVYGGAVDDPDTLHYTDFQWYEVKGAKGDDGDSITSVTRTSGDGSPGTDDTYTVYVNSTAVGTFIVHNGTDGIGAVNSINEIGVDLGTNNVTLTAADVGAPTIPLHIQATVTSLPKTISNSSITATMRVVDLAFGTPSAIKSDISWTTADGSIVLSGTMSGSTTADIVLIETT